MWDEAERSEISPPFDSFPARTTRRFVKYSDTLAPRHIPKCPNTLRIGEYPGNVTQQDTNSGVGGLARRVLNGAIIHNLFSLGCS